MKMVLLLARQQLNVQEHSVNNFPELFVAASVESKRRAFALTKRVTCPSNLTPQVSLC